MTCTRKLLLAALLTATPALAQSLNVDIDRASGTGSGAPSFGYTAASGQIGVWNSFVTTAAGAVNMLALNGTNSGVTCTKQSGSSTSSSVAGASTDYSKLLFDYMDITGQGAHCGVTLNGVDPGLYRLYVYSAMPGSAGQWVDNFNFTNYYDSLIVVKVGGNQAFSTFCGGGPVVANTWTRGNNYVVGNLYVGNGAPAIDIEAHTGYTNNEKAALNGFQLVKYDTSVLYVNDDAVGANTGLSWYNAFTRLSEALEVAKASNGQIHEIWVAAGTYYPTGGQASNIRTTSFELVQGCKVLGGFAGNESSADQRDFTSNLTMLSGNIGSPNTNADNSYHVVKATSVNSTAVLDGVTIFGGNSNVNDNNDKGGGAIITDASPTFRHVTFLGNASRGAAGAVSSIGSGAPVFEDCTFYYNTSLWGGAAIDYEGPVGFFAPVLKINRCAFQRNQSSTGHGGLLVRQGSSWISNSVFSGNSSGEGGAVAAGMPNASSSNASAALYNCTVNDNSGFVQSGGLYAYNGGVVSARNSIIYYNTSGNAWRGKEFEQLYAQPDSTVTATYCDIQDDDRTPFAGAGNFTSLPGFVNRLGPDGLAGTGDDDLSLADGSACIDRGTNSAVPIDYTDADANGNTSELTPWDMAGLTRKVDDPATTDFGSGTAPIIDVGAYEFQAPPCPADYNQDGGIDGADVEAFFFDWENGDTPADVNRDGGIDGADVEAFYAAWENGGC